MKDRTVCLSFDFEECDLPREHGVDFPIEKGMAVSKAGAEIVLDILKRQGVPATIFCTLNFAERAPEIVRRILNEGHELAAHGVDHWHQDETDPRRCKEGLERLAGRTVVGYRQPRMFPVSDAELKAQGYRYNSSLNPAFVPGRYAHLGVPRRPFVKDALLQIPASVVPVIRFPLFWLALHLLPVWLYLLLVRLTLAWDGLFVTYFHPWEFFPEIASHPDWKIPALIRCHAGAPMATRLERVIASLKSAGAKFTTLEAVCLCAGRCSAVTSTPDFLPAAKRCFAPKSRICYNTRMTKKLRRIPCGTMNLAEIVCGFIGHKERAFVVEAKKSKCVGSRRRADAADCSPRCFA